MNDLHVWLFEKTVSGVNRYSKSLYRINNNILLAIYAIVMNRDSGQLFRLLVVVHMEA
jgi:hypothetical protein